MAMADNDAKTNATIVGLMAMLVVLLMRNASKHPFNGWLIILLCVALSWAGFELEATKDKLKVAIKNAETKEKWWLECAKEKSKLEGQVKELTVDLANEVREKEEALESVEGAVKKATANAFAVAAGDSARVAAAMMQRAAGELHAAPKALAVRAALCIKSGYEEE
jgi:hypothetical protein